MTTHLYTSYIYLSRMSDSQVLAFSFHLLFSIFVLLLNFDTNLPDGWRDVATWLRIWYPKDLKYCRLNAIIEGMSTNLCLSGI